MKIGRTIGLGVLGIALNLAPATEVFADGGDTTLVHGCVNTITRAVRIVGANANCQNNENPRHWPNEGRIVTDENRITNTENKNTTQDSAISAIQTKNTQQDAAIAALQGQVGGGSSGLVVKDSLGQVVGKLIDYNSGGIFLKIGTDSLRAFVRSSGFVNFGQVVFNHTTTNCSGTRYIFSERSIGEFTDVIGSFDGYTGYYATLPAQELGIQSQEIVQTAQEFAGVGDCLSFGSTVLNFVALPGTVNFNNLGAPPFHLE